ncbi:MAG: ATP-dependent DNA ligase [Corynebacteriales bacterium]|nr:ATP-dependent DNA ligase [Mycobacteriales bacterium]
MEVAGRSVKITNPDKVLFPENGFAKQDLLAYYLSVADEILPHLRDRPLSIVRYPDGVDKPGFFGKNAPRGTPEWVRTVRLPSPGSTKNRDEIDYIVVDEVATLAWLANLAAVELHVPQWRISDGLADRLMFDLDPGEGTGIRECCQVARLIKEALAADGLEAYPKTSGGKGLHIYVPISPIQPSDGHSYGHALAQKLERDNPELIVSNMRKELRIGKVLIDWSQNNPAKTTVATFSVRAKAAPRVSTPLTWRQVASGRPKILTAREATKSRTELASRFSALLKPSQAHLPGRES